MGLPVGKHFLMRKLRILPGQHKIKRIFFRKDVMLFHHTQKQTNILYIFLKVALCTIFHCKSSAVTAIYLEDCHI